MARPTSAARRSRPTSYLFFFAFFAILIFLIHVPFLNLPYYWDELGHFVPAALDLYRSGSWIPHSTVPNVHPPGLMAYLAVVWTVAGYSVVATRCAMLLLASAAVLVVFLLAIKLCPNIRGAPALLAVVLLLVSPLFYSQAMLAQLDMPAMLFTCLALLLFLDDRPAASAVACTMLVLVKETGLIVAVVLAGWLCRERRFRQAALFLAPAALIGLWAFLLQRNTGSALGNEQFAAYNVRYLMHPVRFAVALCRRFYYLFIAGFHWIGTAAIVLGWRSAGVFRTRRPWAIAGTLVLAHVLAFSFLGGAMLERYLLPVLPLVYIAMVSGLATLPGKWKVAGQFALLAGIAASNFLIPPYPFPLENNLAFTNFVRLQQAAAESVEFRFPGRRIATTWPLQPALERPELGYVQHKLSTVLVADFQPATLAKLTWSPGDVLVIYPHNSQLRWNLMEADVLMRFWRRFYGYQPDVRSPQLPGGLTPELVGHLTARGQWIDVYVAGKSAF